MNRQNQIQEINADIQKISEILKQEKNKNTLEDKVLDLLGEIEERVSLIIGDKKERTPVEKEQVFQRYIHMNHIDTQHTSIDDILDTLITKLYQEIKNRKIKLPHDIFKPGTSEIQGKGEAQETKEIQTVPKIKILQRVLYSIGYDTKQIQQYEEQINPKRMREVPYQIFHLKEKNNEKTVLVCDQIGQATFIYDGIIEPSIFQSVQKGETIGSNIALKIIYSKNTYQKNLEIALDNTIETEEKQQHIVNESEEKGDIKIVTKQHLQDLWIQGEIPEECLGGRKWGEFAKNWNEKNSEEKGYELLISIIGLIGKLGGDKKKPQSKEYIKSLLEGKEYIENTEVTKNQLQDLWIQGEIPEECLGGRKWGEFSKNWNKKNSEEKGYELPTSISGLIGKLGGNRKISTSKEYTKSLLEGNEYVEYPEITNKQLQNLWKQGEIPEEYLSSKWGEFSKDWNEKNSKEKGYELPTSIPGLIGKLGGDTKISLSREYVKSLLEGKEYVKNPEVTKKQLQDLWNEGEIPEEFLWVTKWGEFAKDWNEKNTKEEGYELPTSINGLIGKLGGDTKISKSKEYIKSLLEGKEYVEYPEITNKQLQNLWKQGEIPEEYLSSKWGEFSKDWNEKNSKEKGYELPTSIPGLIGKLGGDKKKPQSKEYIKSLLEGKEYIENTEVIKNQLQDLWIQGEIPEECLGGRKWGEFSKNWNKKNSEEKGYELPTSTNGLIGKLGGDIKISSSKEYVKSLLEGKGYVENPEVTKNQLQNLWIQGKILEECLGGTKWGEFSKDWNEKNTKEEGYELPTSINGLIGKLGGDTKISKSKEYIKSLLEGKGF